MKGVGLDAWRLAGRFASPGSAWAAGSRPGIELLDLPTTRVRLRASPGSGRTVVFAADPPMVVEQYDRIFEELSGVCRVACFEAPGCGFSFPRSGFGFSRHDYTRVLLAVLERLGPGPYVLAFPCWTAYQAVEAAAARPDLIEALVLMQATSWGAQQVWARAVARAFGLIMLGLPLFGDRLFATPYLGQALCALVERRFAERTAPYVIHRGFQRPDLVSRFRAAGRDAFSRGACNCQASILQEYFRGTLDVGPLEVPALLLWGTRDRSHQKSDRGGLRAQVPRAVVRLIEDTGHHLEHESPEQVCREIRTFLAELPAAANRTA